jgi:hypothetical protein
MLKNNKKFAIYNSDIVVLDLLYDNFSMILNIDEDNIIKKIEDFTVLYADFLYEANILEKINILKIEGDSEEFLEERWMLPTFEGNYLPPKVLEKLKTIYTLAKCSRIVNAKGLIGIIRAIEDVKSKFSSPLAVNETLAKNAMHMITKFYFLSKNNSNCLTYSFCLVYILLKLGLQANLVIGVRTRPFYSHAWVEHNRKILNDDARLREKLSVILEV